MHDDNDDNFHDKAQHHVQRNVRSQRVKAPSSFDPLLSGNVFPASIEQLTVNLDRKVKLEW